MKVKTILSTIKKYIGYLSEMIEKYVENTYSIKYETSSYNFKNKKAG